MKKRILLSLLLVLVLCLLTACGEKTDVPAEPAEPTATESASSAVGDGAVVRDAVPQGKIDYLGGWKDAENDEVVMTVVPTQADGDFAVLIRRSDSPLETTEWSLNALFNEETGVLEYQNGFKFERSYSEDGKSVTEKQIWGDSQGSFRLNEEKQMEWTDDKEDFSSGRRFTRTYAKTPSETQFTEEFYRFVSHLEEGTAGASLKQASAACKVVDFADRLELWNVDTEELRKVMVNAWQKLTKTEQENFSKNFPHITKLMAATLSKSDVDYSAFDDAGCGEKIRELTSSDFARFAWATLFANMLTLD